MGEEQHTTNIFELRYVDYKELFEVQSFERIPLVIFRSATSKKSKWDLSKYITESFPHIQLSLDLKVPDYVRFNRIELDKDPKTTVDIITVFTRLYDEDKNDESLIGEDILNQLNILIEKYTYSKLFIEADLSFDYEWLDDVFVKEKQLVIGE